MCWKRFGRRRSTSHKVPATNRKAEGTSHKAKPERARPSRALWAFWLCLLPSAFCLPAIAGSLRAATDHSGAQDGPGRVETLRSINALPPEICNTFREPLGFQQTESGVYYVFDRREHAV